MSPAFVFDCSVTNYHKLSGINQQPRITSQLCRSEVWAGSTGSSAQGLTRKKSTCQLGWAFIWWFWDRIRFLAPPGLWLNSVPCSSRNEVLFLLAGGWGCSQLLEVVLSSFHVVALISATEKLPWVKSLSHFEFPSSGRRLIALDGTHLDKHHFAK